MTSKRETKKPIQGWLPQEPTLLTHHKPLAYVPYMGWWLAIGIIGGLGAAGLLVLFGEVTGINSGCAAFLYYIETAFFAWCIGGFITIYGYLRHKRAIPKARNMITKVLINHLRGWFPQEPTLNIIKSEAPQEPNALLALPAPTLGTIMIVASLLSAVFGAVLIWIYLILNTGTGYTEYVIGLHIGILSLAAFVVGLSSGIMLLSGKHTAAMTGIVTVLAFGLATLIIPVIEGEPSTSGLLFASPMIASSIAALSVTCHAMSKPAHPNSQPSVRERVFVGLAASGGGLTAIGALFYLVPLYPKEEVVIVTLVIGIPLLMAALCVKKTTKEHEGI